MSSKLCNSASFHLVARPSNTVSGTFPIIPYIRFLEGQGRGNTSECVYREGSVPFRFHLTLNFFPPLLLEDCFDQYQADQSQIHLQPLPGISLGNGT